MQVSHWPAGARLLRPLHREHPRPGNNVKEFEKATDPRCQFLVSVLPVVHADCGLCPPQAQEQWALLLCQRESSDECRGQPTQYWWCKREGGRERERVFIPICRSMISAFLEALQAPEKMWCSKVRWQLCTCSESHLDTRPWKHSTNLAQVTR